MSEYNAAVKEAMRQFKIKTEEGFHGARHYKLPPHPDDNYNTTGGRESRGNSRGRSAKSGASSREPSSERGERSKKDCVRAKYNLAKMQYKYARETMIPYKRQDFWAVAIKLCETDPSMSVLDYLRMHPGTPEDKYYQEVKTMFPDFQNTEWEYKPSNPRSIYKYHIDRAATDLKKAGIDYNTIMSKATMAALAINKSRASPEDQKLLFQEYIAKHSTPDDMSRELVQEHFSSFSHDRTTPGESAPSDGRAPHAPVHPRGGGGRKTTLDRQVGGDGFGSSFDTQHFGEAVPDEYRV